jgi:hypothetical protein
MAVLLGLVVALIVLSGLDKLLWASSYEERRQPTSRRSPAHGGQAQARSSRRHSPARGWTR